MELGVHEFFQKAVTSFRENSFDIRMKDHGKIVEFGTHKNARRATDTSCCCRSFHGAWLFCFFQELAPASSRKCHRSGGRGGGNLPGKGLRSLQKWILDAAYPGRPMQQPSVTWKSLLLWEGGVRNFAM